jgi:hypothetical protein
MGTHLAEQHLAGKSIQVLALSKTFHWTVPVGEPVVTRRRPAGRV